MTAQPPPRSSLAALLHEPLAPVASTAEAGDRSDLATAPATDPAAGCRPTPPAEPVGTADTPLFLRAPRQIARAPAWHWGLLALLFVLLALQVLLAERTRLAADARWRPLLAAICRPLGCTLPPWHEPDAFALLDRQVRPLANDDAVLQVRASFRNDARWPQAWPALRLSLADADGRLIGSRVIAPHEYLRRAPAADERLLPGQSARIAFRVREPAAETAAFTFELR